MQVEKSALAIVLDERARALIARRRAKERSSRLHVSVQRGSLRAYAPWIVCARWLPGRHPYTVLQARCDADAEVYADPRIAEYTQVCDLVISAAGIGRWQWPAVADPFAYEHMREWERESRAARAEEPAISPGRRSGACVALVAGAGPKRPRPENMVGPAAIAPTSSNTPDDIGSAPDSWRAQ